jgi:hypothetical protein
MYRIAGIAVALIVVAGCGGKSDEERVAEACGIAAERIGPIAGATSLEELHAETAAYLEVIDSAIQRFDKIAGDDAEGPAVVMGTDVEALRQQVEAVDSAAASGDTTAVTAAVDDAQSVLDQLDEDAATLELPDCASNSWGRTYFDTAGELASATG